MNATISAIALEMSLFFFCSSLLSIMVKSTLNKISIAQRRGFE